MSKDQELFDGMAVTISDLTDAIERVRELHAREEDAESYEICDYCCMLYPCPTIKALDGEQ
jgi:hypothetical protein